MGEPKSYLVATLADMAAIPIEARERFLAELPSMLDSWNQAQEIAEAIEAQADWPAGVRLMPREVRVGLVRAAFGTAQIKWIDDDKSTATLSLRATADSDPIFRESRKIEKAQQL